MEPDPRREPLLPLAAILALAAGLRVFWVLQAARLPRGIHDPLFYLLSAIQLAQGGGYARLDDGTPTAYYPVGYPFALSLLFRAISGLSAISGAPGDVALLQVPELFAAAHAGELAPQADALGHLVLSAALLNAALGTTTVAIVYALTRRLAGGRAALVAALAVAVLPSLVMHAAPLLSEPLFNCLFGASLVPLVAVPWRDGQPSAWRLVLSGVLLGLATLVRPISLLLLPFFPVVLSAGGGGARGLAKGAVVALAAAATIAPWTIRNIVSLRSPVLVATSLSDSLCIGHHRGAPGHFVLTQQCAPPFAYGDFSNPEYELRRAALSFDRAFAFALANPATELRLLGRKARYLWQSDTSGLLASESYGDDPFLQPAVRRALERVANAFYFATLALGGVGMFALAKRWREGRTLLVLVSFLVFGLAPLAVFGHPRFHVPALPLLAIAAGVAVDRAWAAAFGAGRADRTD